MHRQPWVVPRAWAEWCAVVDFFIGVALIFFR